MNTAALLGMCGLGVGAGLFLLAAVWRRPSSVPEQGPVPARARQRRLHARRWALAALAAGIAAAVLTGWLVAAPLAAAAVWYLPRLRGARCAGERTTEVIEAVAGWTEMLRDTLAAGAGLEQTISATATTAPQPVRPHIQALARAIDAGEELPTALRRLADKLEDPTADLVISALILSSRHQARQLGARLGALAEAARAQVEMRRRVAVAQARVRTTVNMITGTTLAFIGGMAVFNRDFLAPYDTLTGQAVLVGIAALFAAGLGWLARLARIEQPARFLAAAGGGEHQ